jgi:hypothetical protein
MGQDLIGYLVKGPYELPEDKKEEAIAHAMKLIRRLRTEYEAYLLDPNYLFSEEVNAYIARHSIDVEMELEQFDMDDVTIEGEATEAVNDLYSIWNGNNARDCYCRTDPDDRSQVLFFCGDATWGDDPDGFAYLTIKECQRYGILEFFNIR